ncbi:DDE family transposase, partial [Nonomuraea fuscirosea]
MSWTPGLNHWGGRAAGVVAESGLVETDPELRAALLALVEPGERGDPTLPLRWTTKSTRRLAGELTQQGHRVSADGVADILRGEGFSLQVNAKTLEGGWHPDR